MASSNDPEKGWSYPGTLQACASRLTNKPNIRAVASQCLPENPVVACERPGIPGFFRQAFIKQSRGSAGDTRLPRADVAG